MASPRIDEQVKNLLRMIREGKYGAESLLNLFHNVDKQKDDDKITEEQHEEMEKWSDRLAELMERERASSN